MSHKIRQSDFTTDADSALAGILPTPPITRKTRTPWWAFLNDTGPQPAIQSDRDSLQMAADDTIGPGVL